MEKSISQRFIITLAAIGFLFSIDHSAQAQFKRKDSVYAFNYWVDVPVTIAGHAFNIWGQNYLFNLPKLTYEDYKDLTPEDVKIPFDRVAARQDPEFADRAHDLSDYGLRVGPAIPLIIMAADKTLRKSFLNLTLMYLETHAIQATLYLMATIPIRRYRPFVYNPEESTERKEGVKSTDSFFSGHVSTVTASTFFIGKVLSDFHPGLQRKWPIVYGIATVPAIWTAYFRLKAGKHFPTDLITGYFIGAVVGIGVPQLHKGKFFHNMAISPMIPRGGGTGLHFALRF